MTSTWGRLRAARKSFSSNASTRIKARAASELLELAQQELCTRSGELEALDRHQTILANELGNHRLHRGAIHLAIHFLREITGASGKRPAAAHPEGAANGAGTRLARALLAPGLLAAAAYLGARLLPLGAGTAAGHVSGHDLMDERFVVSAAEGDIRELDLARGSRIF
jgi:hypothetical protein